MNEKIYPDTEQGAFEFLAKESTHDPKTFLKAIPDPAIEGVWEVTRKDVGNGIASIIYMAGYKDPFGNIRKYNDFEDLY